MTRVMGPAQGDSFQHMWALWWAKHAWLDLGQAVNDVTHYYWPVGMYNPLLSASLWSEITLLPVTATFGPVLSFNLGMTLDFVLTGLTTYLLLRHLVNARGAALLGSALFAFSGARISHAGFHLAHLTIYMVPLYVLLLVRLGEKVTLLRALAAGAVLFASMLANFSHIFLLLIPLTAILALFRLASMPGWRSRSRYAVGIAGMGLVAGMLWLPFGLPMVTTTLSPEGDFLYYGISRRAGIDVLSFFAPSPGNVLWGQFGWVATLFGQINPANQQPHPVETFTYIGLISLLLVTAALRWNRKGIGVWVVVTLTALVLSLGPYLKFDGQLVGITLGGTLSNVPLPFYWLSQLPVIKGLSLVFRFNQLMMLGVAILTAYGTAALMQRLHSPARGSVVLGLALFISVLDTNYAFPARTAPATDVSPFFRAIAHNRHPGALFVFPSTTYSSQGVVPAPQTARQLLDQMTHQRPISGGYIWRRDSRVVGPMTQLEQTLDPIFARDIFPRPKNLPAYLSAIGFAYVVVYKRDAMMPPGDLARVKGEAARQLGAPVFEDDQIVAFEVKPAPAQDQPAEPFVAAFDGWYGVEGRAGEQARRWTEEQATLYAQVAVTGTYRMTGTYTPLTPTNTVALYQGARAIPLESDAPLPGGTRLFTSAPFELAAGKNMLAIKSPAGCAHPANAPQRCYAFNFEHIELALAK